MGYFIIGKKTTYTTVVSCISDYFSSEQELSQPTKCHLKISKMPLSGIARKVEMTPSFGDITPGMESYLQHLFE